MTDTAARHIREQNRFRGILEKSGMLEHQIRLSTPALHGDEMEYVDEAFQSGQMMTAGENIDRLEKEISAYVGVKYAVALDSGSSAIHMAVKLAAEKLYGSSTGIAMPGGIGTGGCLYGKRVFCSDFTSSMMVNPVLYEGGEPVFVDASARDWSMDPEVLEMAFDRYPDVKLVLMNHAYGFPGKIQDIKRICEQHDALLIEDASESFGARVHTGAEEHESGDEEWRQTGSFGDYGVLDFSGDRIITGSAGGILLTNDSYSCQKAKSWASLATAAVPWRQHEEIGYDCRMSNVIAGIVRGQLRHLEEHIAKKKAIYERYQKMLDNESGLIYMNPIGEGTEPNYWISCITCESSIQFNETRSERSYTYTDQHGTASPMEIYDALKAFHVQSSPVYKPMSMQPIFQNHDQVTLDGSRRSYEDFYNAGFWIRGDVGKYNYDSGLCLPSDVNMTEAEQDRVMEIVLACFDK